MSNRLYLVLAVWTAAAAAPSAAQTIPEDLSPSLTYQVRGEVAARCGLSGTNQTVTIADLASPTSDVAQVRTVDLAFDIACNTPVLATLTSTNGGLLVGPQVATSDPDFQRRVDYTAALTLPGDAGAIACRSDAMIAGEAACRLESSGDVTQGAGRLRVTTQAGGRPLLAGQYADRVTLVISPLLSGGA